MLIGARNRFLAAKAGTVDLERADELVAEIMKSEQSGDSDLAKGPITLESTKEIYEKGPCSKNSVGGIIQPRPRKKGRGK